MAPLMFFNDFVFPYIFGCLMIDRIVESENKILSKFICWNFAFFKMAEISKMATNFHMAINRLVFNQFKHVNAIWKRYVIVLHGNILKKYFFKLAEICKMAALSFKFSFYE
jgi:hypothetical protein